MARRTPEQPVPQATLLVLAAVGSEPRTAYAVARTLQGVAPKSTVYGVFRRLEEDGLVTPRSERARRTYRITARGRRELELQLRIAGSVGRLSA